MQESVALFALWHFEALLHSVVRGSPVLLQVEFDERFLESFRPTVVPTNRTSSLPQGCQKAALVELQVVPRVLIVVLVAQVRYRVLAQQDRHLA